MEGVKQNVSQRYEKCVEASKRIRWEIDKDVIKGRQFDFRKKFLPDSLAKMEMFQFLNERNQKLISHIQGRTYANIFGLVERFINAKVLELSEDHWLGDQIALEALVRFSDEELKHQELFRRIENMIAQEMPEGYTFTADPNEVAKVVLGKSTWSILALTCHIELFTQDHYKQSIKDDNQLSELYRDVFLFHWKEESQHAILDELEWQREDAKLTNEERDSAVTELIELVVAVDGILQAQAKADAKYFCSITNLSIDDASSVKIEEGFLKAYRWQYIVSGIKDGPFMNILCKFIDEKQVNKISEALATVM